MRRVRTLDAIEITQFRDMPIEISSSNNRWCIP